MYVKNWSLHASLQVDLCSCVPLFERLRWIAGCDGLRHGLIRDCFFEIFAITSFKKSTGFGECMFVTYVPKRKALLGVFRGDNYLARLLACKNCKKM